MLILKGNTYTATPLPRSRDHCRRSGRKSVRDRLWMTTRKHSFGQSREDIHKKSQRLRQYAQEPCREAHTPTPTEQLLATDGCGEME